MARKKVSKKKVHMATIGPNSGSTFNGDGTVGTVAVVNPGFAVSSNNQYVTWDMAGTSDVGNYLLATGFGFGVPDGSRILGIQVDIEKLVSVGMTVIDNSVVLSKGGFVIGGSDRASATPWAEFGDAYSIHGGPADLWGQTWSPAEINDALFGVAISPIASGAAAGEARVDHILITVTYQGGNKPQCMEQRFSSGDGMSVTGRTG